MPLKKTLPPWGKRVKKKTNGGNLNGKAVAKEKTLICARKARPPAIPLRGGVFRAQVRAAAHGIGPDRGVQLIPATRKIRDPSGKTPQECDGG